jgi:hypothetical protein
VCDKHNTADDSVNRQYTISNLLHMSAYVESMCILQVPRQQAFQDLQVACQQDASSVNAYCTTRPRTAGTMRAQLLHLTWLRTTAAVRPTPLLPLPVVYTARGATLATCFSS